MMVKIRYAELPTGLHVVAETRGRDAIVYLRPGLTPAERQAALNRVRSSGRMGHGPRLHAASIAMAVGADRIQTTAHNVAAATRRHPILLLAIPGIVVVLAAIVLALASASAPGPHSTGQLGPAPRARAVGMRPDGSDVSPVPRFYGAAGPSGGGPATQRHPARSDQAAASRAKPARLAGSLPSAHWPRSEHSRMLGFTRWSARYAPFPGQWGPRQMSRR